MPKVDTTEKKSGKKVANAPHKITLNSIIYMLKPKKPAKKTMSQPKLDSTWKKD